MSVGVFGLGLIQQINVKENISSDILHRSTEQGWANIKDRKKDPGITFLTTKTESPKPDMLGRLWGLSLPLRNKIR